uniref:Uncharacterized protein n=1 Tax=Tanacetum cinerariifolium TaxID=118510 RepID=A0A6L2MFL9_TANCI|nr:hypothetical protein [Tanacetum cinerariifolium]
MICENDGLERPVYGLEMFVDPLSQYCPESIITCIVHDFKWKAYSRCSGNSFNSSLSGSMLDGFSRFLGLSILVVPPALSSALAVARKGLLKMIGTSLFSSISKTTNSTGKIDLLIFTNRFSQTPMGPVFFSSPSMKLSADGRGMAGKGGACVLIPDLVVMAKVGTLGEIQVSSLEALRLV